MHVKYVLNNYFTTYACAINIGSGRSSLDELKALRELKHLKEIEDSTFGN